MVLLAATLSTCEPNPTEKRGAAVGQALLAVLADEPNTRSPGGGQGPLVVDSQSVRVALQAIAESDEVTLPAGARWGTTGELVRCAQASWEHGCAVEQDAILLSLDRVEKDSAGYTTFVTISRTLDGPQKSVCPIQVRYRVERQAERWVIARRDFLSAC